MRKPPKPYKTRQARPSEGSMVKPGELIDFVEMSPLLLSDRRIYNLLIAHAWDQIDQPVTHVLPKRSLANHAHESTDRVGDSVERLMAAIVRTYVEIDGKPAIQRAQLLGSTTEARAPDGLLYYRFSEEMRAIIRDSNIFARLHKDLILHLSSKYSLALYELCKRRVNLDNKWSEEFTVERFRGLLGVGPETLPAFKSLNQRAIQPAVAEVNLLCDFGCKVEPIVTGRKVVKIKLSWWRKNPDELKAAYRELEAAKVGRRARSTGAAESIVDAGSPPTGGKRL
jgi:Initiator Rep protein, WH2/Initiator Replication protein, WH1